MWMLFPTFLLSQLGMAFGAAPQSNSFLQAGNNEYETGQYAEAEKQPLTAYELTIRQNDPVAGGPSLRYLELRTAGRTEYLAGHLASAETLLRDARDSAVRAADDEALATIDNNLGDVYLGEERLDDAEQAYARSLRIFKGMGRDFEVAVTLRNLGAAYSLHQRSKKALKVLDEASKLSFLRTPGGDRNTQALAAELANTRGIVLFRENSLEKARRLFEEALRIRRDAGLDGGVGDDGTLNNIGMIYVKQRRYAEAEVPLLRSIEITSRVLGSSHPDLTLSLPTLGEVYTRLGRYSEAKEQYQRSLSILWNMSPRLVGRIARTLELVSGMYLKQGDKTDAESAFTEAIDFARRVKVADDPGMPDMFDRYAALLRKLGKPDQAREVYAEAQLIRVAAALTVRASAQ
jgi:tetratricopeptide (TPR) repeat protein